MARGTLLIFGTGFIGEQVARHAAECGFRVLGTTRRRGPRVAELYKNGILQQEALRFTGTEPLPEAVIANELSEVTHVLSTIPPSLGTDPVLEYHAGTITDRMPQLRWCGLLSTAAVYGPAAQVDGFTTPSPKTSGERLRMLIERQWAGLELPRETTPVCIFRPTGVYGPWRGPQEQLRTGRAVCIEKPGHATSRIHVDDVATAVVASMMQSDAEGSALDDAAAALMPSADGASSEGCPVEGSGCSTYLLADTEPAAPADVLRFTADLYGCPRPASVPYDKVEPRLSSPAKAFWATPMRADSTRARAALGIELAHPDYKSGLAAVKEAEGPEGAEAIALAAVPPPDAELTAPVAPIKGKRKAAAKAPTPVPATPQASSMVRPASPGDDATAAALASLEDEEQQLAQQLEVVRRKREALGDGLPPAAAPRTGDAPGSPGPAQGLPDALGKLKVVELKDLLRQRGLKVSGTKAELIQRLMTEPGR